MPLIRYAMRAASERVDEWRDDAKMRVVEIRVSYTLFARCAKMGDDILLLPMPLRCLRRYAIAARHVFASPR